MRSRGLKTGDIGAALRQGLAWWGRGLRALLPRWIVAIAIGNGRLVEMQETSGGCLLLSVRGSANDPISTATISDGAWTPASAEKIIRSIVRSRPAILRCPESLLLEKTIAIPAAACEDLSSTVRFGMRAWTSFEPHEVFYAVLKRAQREHDALISIRLVPRSALVDLLQRVAAAKIEVAAISLGSDKALASVGCHRPRGSFLNLSGSFDAALALSAVTLCAVLLSVLALNANAELADYRRALKAEILRLDDQRKVEADIHAIDDSLQFVKSKRQAAPRVSTALRDFADLLPDGANVMSVEWAQDRGRATLLAPSAIASADFPESKSLTTRVVGKEQQGDRHIVTIDLVSREFVH